jgi:hypothetical protein
MVDESFLVTVTAHEASDSWGFVGVVLVGDLEVYRTIRAYSGRSEAQAAAQQLLADALGGLMAGHEWRTAAEEFGHPPRRHELGLGFRSRSRADPSSS